MDAAVPHRPVQCADEGGHLSVLQRWHGELANQNKDALSSLRFELTGGDLPELWASLPAGEAVFWAEPGESVRLGWQSARTLRSFGARRFQDVRDALQRALAGIPRTHQVRAYGGFAFAPESATEAPWQPFGDATFVIPRWSVIRSEELVALVLVGDGSESLEVLEAEFLHIQQALREPGSVEPLPVTGPLSNQAVHFEEPDPDAFFRYVSTLRDGMGRGRYDKVVAAQRTELTFDQPIDIAVVLRGLAERFSDTTRFAFRRDEHVFLGATPERLISVSDTQFETEALAGTASSSVADPEKYFRESAKELGEHAYVVEDVQARLSPLVSRLHVEKATVRVLPDVLHLATRMHGECKRGANVLDFVSTLHPTSAVGGVPRSQALEAIAELEATPRGWYAGPVGWVDGEGNGSFWVALRSGLVFGDHAWLYAGAGIVRDSDPASEYEETTMKRAAMLEVLAPAVRADRKTSERNGVSRTPNTNRPGSQRPLRNHENPTQTYGSAR